MLDRYLLIHAPLSSPASSASSFSCCSVPLVVGDALVSPDADWECTEGGCTGKLATMVPPAQRRLSAIGAREEWRRLTLRRTLLWTVHLAVPLERDEQHISRTSRVSRAHVDGTGLGRRTSNGHGHHPLMHWNDANEWRTMFCDLVNLNAPADGVDLDDCAKDAEEWVWLLMWRKAGTQAGPWSHQQGQRLQIMGG